VNVPIIAMAVATGISVDAALMHGFVGLARRPRDAVRVTFAVQALAVAAGALAIVVMYTTKSPYTHFEVMKWVFFPAGVVWSAATMWLVAFYTGVRPMRWLLALSAGFCAFLVLNLILPYGLLHYEVGSMTSTHLAGADVAVMADPSPHPLNYAADALVLAAFIYMCYAAWRVYRRGEHRKAWFVAAALLLFLVTSVADSYQAYGILSDPYLTQLGFAALVLGVSIALRRESLRVEAELRVYRDHLESLVDERMRDLDEAHTRLALESQERLATAESLRQRVAELDALHRVSRTLAERGDLTTALDQIAPEIAALMSSSHARVDLAGADNGSGPPVILGTAEHLVIEPLVAHGETIGTLSVARNRGAPFTNWERRLAQMAADDVAAAVENERLHDRQLQMATQEERQRLARDLHDAVTQTIYSAALIAEALPSVWERDPSAGLSNLVRLQRLVRAGLAELRSLLFELRPAALEAAPLQALLDRLGDALAGQIQVPVNVRAGDDLDLPAETKLVFYRVAQEAFSNIAKHSHATEVTAEVAADGDGVVSLCVHDDGRGFDPGAVGADSMGLRIMRERLDEVGASLAVDSKPGGGTTITAVWPIRPQARAPVKTRWT